MTHGTLAAVLPLLAFLAIPQGSSSDTGRVRVVATDQTEYLVDFSNEVLYDADQSTALNVPAFVAPTPWGYYVTDWGDKLVVAFDDAGIRRFEFGSEGQGPGEMGDTWQIFVATGSDVYVWDRLNRKLHRYRSDGEFVEALALPPAIDTVDPTSIAVVSPTRFVVGGVSLHDDARGNGAHIVDIRSADGDLSLVRTRSFAPTQAVDPLLYGIVAAGSVSLDIDGNVLYAQGSPFLFAKYTPDGDLLWQIEMPDAFPHWKEFFSINETGQVEAETYSHTRGIWPLAHGLYVAEIRDPNPEFQEWSSGPRAERFTGHIFDNRYQLLWIHDGQLSRWAALQIEADADLAGSQVVFQDNKRRFYRSTADLIVRTTLAVQGAH